MTRPLGYRQSAAEAAFYLLALCLPTYQSLLFAGIERTIFVFLLTCLLLFLVVRSTEIYQVVADCVMAFWSRLILPLTPKFRAISLVSLTIPSAPTLSTLFQRPPPLFS